MRFRPSFAPLVALAALGACTPASRPASAIGTARLASGGDAPFVVPLSEEVLNARLERITASRNYRLGLPNHFAFPEGVNGIFYLQAEATKPTQSLYFANFETETVELVLSPSALTNESEQLSAAEKARRERMRAVTGGFSQILPSPDGTRLLLPIGSRLFVASWDDKSHKIGKTIALSPEGATDPTWSPDGRFILFVRDGNLYSTPSDGTPLPGQKPASELANEEALTTDGTLVAPVATAEFVAQEEFARSRGYWVSPDGADILVETVDQREVERVAIVDVAHPEREPERPYYPRAGKKNARIGFDILTNWQGKNSRKTRQKLPWDANEFPYVATVTWRAASGGVPAAPYFYAVDRPQKKAALLRWEGARFVRVGEDRDEAFLNAEGVHPFFLAGATGGTAPGGPPQYGDAGPFEPGSFVREADAETAPRLGIYGPNGELRAPLLDSSGPVDLKRIVAVFPGSRSASSKDGPAKLSTADVGRPACRGCATEVLATVGTDGTDGRLVRFAAGAAPETIAEEKHGAVDAFASEDGKRQVIVRYRDDARPTWEARSGSHRVAIPDRSLPPDFLPHLEMLTVGPEKTRVAVLRPSYPIPQGVKLPILDAAYGGPGVAIVSPNMVSYARSQWIADATGAIVVTIDAPGTPGRGRTYERAIANAFATTPIDGHLKALEALRAQIPEGDFSRIGVFGWSFGGYFAALAALDHPDVYKAAVAGAPPADWRDYDTAYTERYLGVPPEGEPSAVYDRANLLLRAAETKAPSPLLLIHGTADDNVYFSSSIKLAEAMQQRGFSVELFPVVGSTHLLSDPKAAHRVWTRVAQFLRSSLASPKAAVETTPPPAPTVGP